MRQGGGKAKGSSFERSTAVALSLWITGGKRDDCYWRSALSGGRATIGFKTGKNRSNQAGDITAIDPVGAWLTDRFIIENKNYSDLDIASGILSNTGRLHKFWIDLLTVSQQHSKCPLLIAKENHRPILLLLSVKGEVYLRLDPQKAIAILPLWHNARVYLFDYLLSTQCMASKNYEFPTPSYSTSRLSGSK